jgi:hypothetical protein
MKNIIPRLLDLWRLIKELFLFVFASVIFIIVAIIGVLYSAIKHLFFKFDYSLSRQLTPIVRSATLLTDGFANAGAGELLNDLLKIDESEKIRYAKWYQTISAVTGLRYLFVKDNKFRRLVDKILGKNHCINAITEQDLFYHNSKK